MKRYNQKNYYRVRMKLESHYVSRHFQNLPNNNIFINLNFK